MWCIRTARSHGTGRFSIFYSDVISLFFSMWRRSLFPSASPLYSRARRAARHHISPYTSRLPKNAYLCSSLFGADPILPAGNPTDASRPRTVPPAWLRAARRIRTLTRTGRRAGSTHLTALPTPTSLPPTPPTPPPPPTLRPVHPRRSPRSTSSRFRATQSSPRASWAPLVSTRAASGAIDASTAAAYEANGKGVKDDGRGRIARAVWGVMRGEM